MKSLLRRFGIHSVANRISLVIDLIFIYPLRSCRAIETKRFSRVVAAGISDFRLQFDLRITKVEMGTVFVRELMVLISVWSLLSGCADTKQAPQADSDSILHKPDSDHEVHGEVGVMYGHTAR